MGNKQSRFSLNLRGGEIILCLGIILSIITYLLIAIKCFSNKTIYALDGEIQTLDFGFWCFRGDLATLPNIYLSTTGIVCIALVATSLLITVSGIVWTRKYGHIFRNKVFLTSLISLCTVVLIFCLFLSNRPADYMQVAAKREIGWIWNLNQSNGTLFFKTGGWIVLIATIVSGSCITIPSIIHFIKPRSV
jgi:hypothetical protein